MDIQLKRGMLDVCVLAAIKDEDSYGYQIIKDMKPYVTISESTLYPILRRLEANAYLTVQSVEHNGRLRKYYHITDAGRARIDEFQEEWKSIWESRGDTTDRIFLLSWKEIERYYGHKLPKAEALLCKPSKAVLQRYEEIEQQRVREKVPFVTSVPDVSEGISWMLRSTGKSQNQISIIRGDGYYSQCMADYYQGVRPAMWIDVGDENGEGQALQE